MSYFIQFYRAPVLVHPNMSPRAVSPIRDSWGSLDIVPDALQWEAENTARHYCGLLLGCVGFRLWERGPDGSAHPCGGVVRVAK